MALIPFLQAAADDNWDSHFGVPGTPGYVYAFATIDQSIYVGGYFSELGGIAANSIARWVGTNWSPLGLGLPPLAGVAALRAVGPDLYVGGNFNQAGGNSATNVAKWDGTNWSCLGAGTDGTVWALAVASDQLYAGGFFISAGGIAASNIAKWNGSAWSPVGGGLNGGVKILETDGVNLYAFGNFTQAGSVPAAGLARWDGQTWQAIPLPFTGPPAAIRVKGPDLFLFATRTPFEDETGLSIKRWDGTHWMDVASGDFIRSDCNDCVARAYDMVVSGKDFYIAGDFDGGIAKWDGSGWSSLGSGVEIFNVANMTLASSGTELFAAGQRFAMAGGKPSANIALWHIPHSLRISRVEDSVTLSWPSTGTNFLLEAVETIGQSNWAPVPQPFSIVNDQCVVTNTLTTSNRFYRSRRK